MSMTRFGRLRVALAFGVLSQLALISSVALAQDEGTGDASSPPSSTVTAEKDDGKGTNADAVADAPAPEPGFLTGGGIKLSDGFTFHPLFELQTGYQSNVFFEDNSDRAGNGEIGAALARIVVGGGIGTTPVRRMEIESPGAELKPKLAFRGDLNLTWNQYLSGNNAVQEQSDLGIGLVADARFNPEGVFTVQLRDGFTRSVLPPSIQSTDNPARDKNEFLLGGVFKPGGGAIEAYANYSFGLDLFESGGLNFANRLSHTFALGGKWQWLPKTQFSGEASLGVVSSPSSTFKDGALPLRVWVGTSTLITPTFGTVLRLGYYDGFYASGAGVPWYSSYLAVAEGRLAIGPTVRVAFGYLRDFADSIIADFYADHAVYGRFSTQFGGRTQLRARAELRFRDYVGVPAMVNGTQFCGDLACSSPSRSDILARVDATLDYQFNPWLILGGSYTFSSDTTDFFIRSTGDTDSGGYVWHELIVRATAKF